MKNLFQEHLQQALKNTYKILEQLNVDSLLIESGTLDYFFLDDQPKSFRPNPHFLYFCPSLGHGHALHLIPGSKKPKLYFYIPTDFWHEVSCLSGEFWESSFDIEIISKPEELWNQIQTPGSNNLVITEFPQLSIEKGFKTAPVDLHNGLNWNRASKSDYEIECMRNANKNAALGHKAAEKAFFEGKSEFEIYNSYLNASAQREADLPYGNIVALDQNTAVLHYQSPKHIPNGKTFLIDAGARFNGYCSDITRTYFQSDVPQEFKDLHQAIEMSQKVQCASLKPGRSYVDIHKMAYESISLSLINLGVIQCSQEQSLELDIPFSFFPHGVGHPIGLQVHDVSGKQQDSSGAIVEQPKRFPFLRTIRDIQVNDVLTIEPGAYFIPLLLKELKGDSVKSKFINWDLVEKLIPFGGIRIEDDVVVRKDGIENISRSYLP